MSDYRKMIEDAKEIISIKLQIERDVINPFAQKNATLLEYERERDLLLGLNKQQGLTKFHKARMEQLDKAISLLTDSVGVNGVKSLVASLEQIANTEIKLIDNGLLERDKKDLNIVEVKEGRKRDLLKLIENGFKK